ncbi:hypothetical protein HN018_13150 [Lichenicola cladoniae]|uniref:Uncharacterized protein n=1 Tax=Lichenicola cladoniae TaxID=1484109 RepID=A0A6M8HR91_9PROT|nr:hypothetical protein [Lichenicola cladoniae]NPD68707.1 hypothetical protein [Acetobacteraceae bacterium]QKE90858.1 hypothetical protein HN018_13150 [Lichenicola cladoniae]
MPHAVDLNASLRPLDYRATADALQEALELRRPGLADAAMHSTMTGVVAELLADALIGAGYVVALPRRVTTQQGLTAETLTKG